MLVVDDSIVVKAFIEEDGSPFARGVWSGGDVLVIPAHGFAEFGEVLARKCRAGEVSRIQVDAALAAAIRSLISVPIEPVAAKAVEIALDLGVSVYDALYVALCDSLRCPLVTADLRLVTKLRGSRFASLMHAPDLR